MMIWTYINTKDIQIVPHDPAMNYSVPTPAGVGVTQMGYVLLIFVRLSMIDTPCFSSPLFLSLSLNLFTRVPLCSSHMQTNIIYDHCHLHYIFFSFLKTKKH